MSKFVKIAAVQFQTEIPEDVSLWGTEKARETILRETKDVLNNCCGEDLDLVVLSEGISAVGQGMSHAEDPDAPGELLSIYRNFAMAEGCHIAGPAKIKGAEGIYNSIVFYDPAGDCLGTYKKVNLTIPEIDEGLRPGEEAIVFDTAIGRIGVAICFDLNFESLRQDYQQLNPDIIIFPSLFHGGIIQSIWAYDCRCFMVSAWQGAGSGIIDPFGRQLKSSSDEEPVVIETINPDYVLAHLDDNRDKFKALKDKYGSDVTIDIPPLIGSVMIISNSEKYSALDLINEFGIEARSDYFNRASEINNRNRIL